MAIEFVRATLEKSYVRMALVGPSGSGKTLTALKIARWLGERVVVIDTERRSAHLYANHPDVPHPYDVYRLQSFKPDHYCQVIDAAVAAKYDVCIVDSISPSWNKKGGILEIAGGDIRGWKAANPEYDKLLDKLTGLNDRIHMIVTVRSKMEYRLEPDSTGKIVVTCHGLAPIHKDELIYEFDVVGTLDKNDDCNTIRFDGVGKQRIPALRGATFQDPGEDLAGVINNWLKGGTA